MMMKRNILIIIVLAAVGAVLFVGLKPSTPAGAWDTFQEYIALAKAHDLEGVKGLSHQVSPTCNDPEKEAECFALMDSVVVLTEGFTQEQFKNIKSDQKQIILYNDGPERAFIYFTRTPLYQTRVLGMRFCLDDAETGYDCTNINATTTDTDADGWWDSVESIFYK